MARPIVGLCDRCGVPVRNYGTVCVSPNTGRSLTFCGHHTNVHRVRLVQLGWLILEPTMVEVDVQSRIFPWLPPSSRPAEDAGRGTEEDF